LGHGDDPHGPEHGPNDSPKERAKFFEVQEEQNAIRLQTVAWQQRK